MNAISSPTLLHMGPLSFQIATKNSAIRSFWPIIPLWRYFRAECLIPSNFLIIWFASNLTCPLLGNSPPQEGAARWTRICTRRHRRLRDSEGKSTERNSQVRTHVPLRHNLAQPNPFPRLKNSLRSVSVAFPMGVNSHEAKSLPRASELGSLSKKIVSQYSSLNGVLEALKTSQEAVEHASIVSSSLPDSQAREKRMGQVEAMRIQTGILVSAINVKNSIAAQVAWEVSLHQEGTN